MSTPTCVYRCWDAAGVLLYVGSTTHFAPRLSQHSTTSPWFTDVDDVTEEWFATTADGRDEERRAIATEGPLHNRQVLPPTGTVRESIGNWSPKHMNASGLPGLLSRLLSARGVSLFKLHRTSGTPLLTLDRRLAGGADLKMTDVFKVAQLLGVSTSSLIEQAGAAA